MRLHFCTDVCGVVCYVVGHFFVNVVYLSPTSPCPSQSKALHLEAPVAAALPRHVPEEVLHARGEVELAAHGSQLRVRRLCGHNDCNNSTTFCPAQHSAPLARLRRLTLRRRAALHARSCRHQGMLAWGCSVARRPGREFSSFQTSTRARVCSTVCCVVGAPRRCGWHERQEPIVLAYFRHSTF